MLDILLGSLVEIRMDVGEKCIASAGDWRRHQQHRALCPVAILSRKVSLQSRLSRQNERTERRTDQPVIPARNIRLTMTWHRVCVVAGGVGSDFRTT